MNPVGRRWNGKSISAGRFNFNCNSIKLSWFKMIQFWRLDQLDWALIGSVSMETPKDAHPHGWPIYRLRMGSGMRVSRLRQAGRAYLAGVLTNTSMWSTSPTKYPHGSSSGTPAPAPMGATTTAAAAAAAATDEEDEDGDGDDDVLDVSDTSHPSVIIGRYGIINNR